ncbi:MAG: LytTR family DNA-binding domain-containing protein [Sphingobacteriales bacterium]|jgi:DNA-binding LytR/AlgR family response regulator|nr:LytTR family DNA-binding domain-containing protein [Sphingobacteriales bacterium]
MNILIIEDEALAAERLQLLLKQYDADIKVLGVLESIEESVQWLQKKASPDLFLMDIHLSDGHCFEIFNQVLIQRPVIFTTAFDNYALNAFQHYSIDYILKPVTAEALGAALNKYKAMAKAFTVPDYKNWTGVLASDSSLAKYKDRFLAKVGPRTFFIQADEIAYFTADNKIVTLADREGNRFIVNYTIEKLEPLLDPHHFFRINRKMIVHSRSIEQVKPHFNNRLKLSLKNLKLSEDIIISRERVAAFKKWAEG